VSFILDALRKSESERQQDAAPNIARIPDAVPHRRLPAWALATMAALALGIVTLGFAWWRTAQSPAATTAAEPAAARLGTPLPIPPQRTQNPTGDPPPVDPAARPTLRDAAVSGRTERGTSSPAGTTTAAAAAESARVPATLPSIDPQLQRYTTAAAGLPPLRLELHAYDEEPASRFVFINGAKYAEGDTLPEGPRVIAITVDGAVLLAGSRQYLLGQE
jgi:general secretion pathway protein B